MIEVYAFLATFTVQIVAFSVLFPARLVRYARLKDDAYPEEIFAKLYPGVDRHLATARFWSRYRAAHTIIAVLGFVLLGWMLGNQQLLGNARAIMFPVFYFLVQVTPMIFLAFIGIRNVTVLRPALQERKRKAVLLRRGLFDFVSPLRVILEVSIYFLFVAFMLYLMYVAKDPIPRSIGFLMLGAVTFGFALEAGWLYWRLFGKKVPLETDADRKRSTGLQARGSVYGTTITVLMTSLILTLPRLGLQGWLPFTLSAFFVLVALRFFRKLPVATHPPAADAHDSDERPTPEVQS